MESMKRDPRNPQLGEPLTRREQQTLDLIVEGLSNKLIGVRLGISEHTAKFHVWNAVIKVGGGGNRTLAAVLWDRQRRIAA